MNFHDILYCVLVYSNGESSVKSRLRKIAIIINFRKLFLLWRLTTVSFVFMNLKEKKIQPFCLLQYFPNFETFCISCCCQDFIIFWFNRMRWFQQQALTYTEIIIYFIYILQKYFRLFLIHLRVYILSQ